MSGVFGTFFRLRQGLHLVGGAGACRLTRSLATSTAPKGGSESRNRVPLLMRSSATLYNVNGGKITASSELKLIPSSHALADLHLIGSSGGFLFSVDREAEIHATNPLTGSHLPLPSTATLPNMAGVTFCSKGNGITHYFCAQREWRGTPTEHEMLSVSSARQHYYSKAIVSPQLDSVVVIHGGDSRCLAFAKINIHTGPACPSSSWTQLAAPINLFYDVIFHKGRLHAIDYEGRISVFDLDNPAGYQPSPFPACPDFWGTHSLVESPDGEDLLVLSRRWTCEDEGDKPKITTDFMVFKLDESCNRWEPVHDIGELAMFVGLNQSLALSSRDFPQLTPNCIYFSDMLDDMKNPQPHSDAGVFNLEDRSLELYPPEEGPQKLMRPRSIWYMPVP